MHFHSVPTAWSSFSVSLKQSTLYRPRRSNSRLRRKARKMGVGAREFLRFAKL